MQTTVFLDLEETLLDTWQDGNLLEVGLHRTRELLKRVRSTDNRVRVGLMSWAVWDQKDKDDFNSRFRPFLEAELRTNFDDRLVWSMDNWAERVFKFGKKKLDRQDLFDMFQKEEVLFKLARCADPEFRNTAVFLVDDRVSHGLIVRVPEHECSVQLLNVNQLAD